jgi:DNA polymerase-3 subunit alpha
MILTCYERLFGIWLMSKFTHLHTHSEFSVLDGMAPIQAIVDKAKADGQTSLALTDHGRLSGVPEFYVACRKADIKPILGQEFYLCLDHTDRTRVPNPETGKKENPATFHLVILARDKRGYEILCELSSTANSPAFYYYRPRIDYGLLEALSRRDRRSLAVSTTCLNGHVPQLILQGKLVEARERLLYMRELFPHLYLELQRHEISSSRQDDQEFDDNQERVNRRLCYWASKYNLPVIITNDSHYVTAEQHDTHDIWLALQTGANWKQSDRFRFNGYGYYVKSTREMKETWADDPDIWRASQRNISTLVGDIECVLPEFEQRVWHIPVAPRENTEIPSDVFMRSACRKRLRSLERSGRLAADIQTYRDRLDYELGIIFEAHFEEEFLVVKDFIDWAKSSGIRVGPGRGSMAGVLSAFLMGIVDVDPVRFGLMFERALNPARPSLPDFDVDFARSRREEVVAYLLEKYNKAPYQAQQVGTFARLGPRGTIQRLLKTLGYSMLEAVAASKSLPDSAQITNLKASGDLNELLKDDNLHHVTQEAMAKHKHFFEWATTIQDLVNGEGRHAAGIVISDESFDLKRLVPTMMVGKGEGRGQKAVVTQYDMDGLKKLGVVKFDILSLDTLDVIQEVCDMIGKDPFVDMKEYEDARVWATVNSGAMAGIFQVEGGASRQVVRDLQLQSFEDLIAVMALGRSGANQFVGGYKEGRDKGVKHLRRALPDKRLLKILPRGVVLYQEQVMEIGLQIAGMDHHVVDELKEAIKYKKGDVWDNLKPIFFNGGEYKGGTCVGALKNGCTQSVAEDIWNMIFAYRGYGFNRAHAVSYAMIAYQTAWLKTYYPVEFYCALLTHKDVRERPGIIDEAKQHFSINFKPPHINRSMIGFAPAGKRGIRYGLTAILGVGVKAAEHIMETRPFFGPDDMRETVVKRKCNKRVLELLVRVGAFRTLGTPGDDDIGKTEMELLGAYVTKHPLDEFRDDIDKRVRRSGNLRMFDRAVDAGVWVGGLVTAIREITTRKGDKMAFLEITYDGLGKWDVVVFPDAWRLYKASLFRGRVVCIYGEKQHERGSIVLDRLEVYAAAA